MKVRITIEVGERERMALSHHAGRLVPASRYDVERWAERTLGAVLGEVCAEWDRVVEEAKAREACTCGGVDASDPERGVRKRFHFTGCPAFKPGVP